MNIIGFSPFGYEGALVTIEVDLRRGIPAVDLVGLADNAVKEARERMRAAIRNAGYEFPLERVLISLSPADVKKEGAGFDLAMGLAVLQEKELQHATEKNNTKILVIGELELSGKLRNVRGIHAALSTAAQAGIQFCIIPHESKFEATELTKMRIYTVETLSQAYMVLSELNNNVNPDNIAHLYTQTLTHTEQNISEKVKFAPIIPEFDYIHLKGQPLLKRAVQVAAAGKHNLMVCGAPGCGKTMALQRFYTLLPLLTHAESLPVSRIYSLAGLTTQQTIIREAPFRSPHQSSSLEGLIGGGPQCKPGDLSLAHNGALFLDETPEFKTSALQALRVPLEKGEVSLSRAGRNTIFPARFQLLMALNPCPCGNLGSQDKICLCNTRAIEQYWRRISAPLADRMDIRINIFNTSESHTENNDTLNLSTQDLRKKIKIATEIQRKRQNKANNMLSPAEITEFCIMTQEAQIYFEHKTTDQSFSGRGIHACIKLARTLADMDNEKLITKNHISEAIKLHQPPALFSASLF